MKRNKNKIEATNCIIKEDYIYFPKGYYFKYGYLKNKKKLPFSVINEIRINTFPVTAKINSNEIVFLLGLDQDECVKIGEKFSIDVIKPIDNWSWLCDDFLDTEFTQKQKDNTILLLEKNGIPKEEIKSIRKRISSRMLYYTFLSWEWQYYGQYDVLKQLWPLNSEKYWWTMDIALRNNMSNIAKDKRNSI